jgi:transposase
MATTTQFVRCAGLRDRPARSLEHRTTVQVLRTTAQRIQVLQAEIDALGGQLTRLVDAIAPWLADLPGVDRSPQRRFW